ncbi:MAG TPA: DNA translocase FtsK, partial [Gemmatimonadales bacterium]|nr:DNA translocase FtsK [Gemmatimonadales bacterium]
MSTDSRRRLGAITALVLGLFLGLTLLPLPITGPVGRTIGHGLWQILGAGALGIPLLGVGLAMAGFDRLGKLDMKRSAILITGLSVLFPYLIGVLTGVSRIDLDPDMGQRGFAASVVGTLPGFFADVISGKIGPLGAVLLGFLALSALTLVTFAWHPLQRLEKSGGGQDVSGAVQPAREEPKRKRRPAIAEEEEESVTILPSVMGPRKEKEKTRKKQEPGSIPPMDEESGLPPISLLKVPPEPPDQDAGQAELDRLGHSLIETLRTFKVDARISGRTTGPVVTQFEVVPAPGVKAGRIVALSDDLAISMRVPSVRIAPIPGKGAVGVEIPNPIARIVMLGELIEPAEWRGLRAALPIALGRDLEGKPVVADLANMPHLLIAGSTGTGKSVTINTIITSLIYRYTPKHLRLLMIDPKMVELSMYNALPHLRHKVVTNNHDAATALKWAEIEMQRRYELLQANGARNIADFNRKVEEKKQLRNPARPKPTLVTISAQPADTPPEPPEEEIYSEGVLPFIVIIIDELADLMMTVQGEVETPLARLAQKARAIGIHLILATQR